MRQIRSNFTPFPARYALQMCIRDSRKTVGVIGLGKTGSEVARLVKSFDMKVLAWDRRRKEAQNVDQVYGAENGDNLNELLAQCDYVVLSLELNDQTFHIIDARCV